MLLFAIALPAQEKTLSGKIYTEDTKLPVSGVSVTMENCNTGSIVTFTSSKSDGSFILSITGVTDSICITFSHISYVQKKLKLSNTQNNIEILLLKKKALELPPVIIKSKPFTKSGDTIKFSVSGYDQANFRSIGDVIRNIPGIEVSPSGQISYNGKAISNYYIEGLDLLEERYSLANENLPKDMVAQVQILLRHQPIRILDSVSKGTNVAVNLKLKEGAKNKLINNATVATGFTNEKLLYNLNLLSVLFNKKFQMLFATKVNNTGADLKQEIIGFQLSDFSTLKSAFIKEDLVYVIKPTPPPLSSNLFLQNRSIAPSVNLLKKVHEYGELKLNLNYINQFSLLTNQITTDFTINNQLLQIKENNRLTGNEQIFKGGVQYNFNSPKLYCKAETRVLLFNTTEKNITTGSLILEQRAKIPAQNFLQTISLIKTKRKIVFTSGLLFSYSNLPQSLHATPGIFPDQLNNSISYAEFTQKIRSTTIRSYQYLSALKKNKNLVQTILVAGEWKLENLSRIVLKDSALAIIPVLSMRNFSWKQLNISTSYEQKNQLGKFGYSVSLPLIFSNTTLQHLNSKMKNKLFFNPILSAGYNFSDLNGVFVEAGKEASFNNYLNSVPFTYFQNYRVQKEGLLTDIPFEESIYLAANYMYSNLLKGFSFSINLRTERLSQNNTPSLIYDGFLEKTILLPLTNRQYIKSVSMGLSKKIEAIKTRFQFRTNLSSNQFTQLNQNTATTFSLLQPGIYAAASIKKIKKTVLDISHRLSFNYFKTLPSQYSLNGQTNITEAALNLFLLKEKLVVTAQQKIYNNRGLSNRNNFLQTDFSVRYKYKKTDFQLSCINLLNEKLYSEYQTFGNIQSWNQYTLTGRQILISYNFTF
jgi:hypothetical protein